MPDSLVIIPMYNERENAAAIIDAVLALEGQHFDILVIDDNSPDGTAAIVCFPGIMYRGGAEKKIRQYLIDNNFIDCVVQLPSNLFFGTSIATCIMVLKKNKVDNKTLFIDATKECIKVTNNNKLTPENIDRIVNTFVNRTEEVHFSHLATYEEIAGQEYNLSVSTYVEAEDTREKIDIVQLNAEITEIVAREEKSRNAIELIVREIEENHT